MRYVLLKQKDKAVIFSEKDLKQLTKAYLSLFRIINSQPASIQDYFDNHKDFMNVAKWHDLLESGEFDSENWE